MKNRCLPNIKLLVFVLAAMFLGKPRVFAQNAGALLMMPENFSAQMLNPSYSHPNKKIMVAIPGLAGFSAWNSGNFKISDVITISEAGNPVLDIRHFSQNSRAKNFIGQQLSIPVLFVAVPTPKGAISFYYKENLYSFGKIGQEVIHYFASGNLDENMQDFKTGNIDLGGFGYREFAFGYARDVGRRLAFGARAKLLFGSAHISLQGWQYSVQTSDNGHGIALGASGRGILSLPVPVVLNFDNRIATVESGNALTDYFTAFRNPGVAIDAGFSYRIDESRTFAGAVRDLGAIWLKSNTYRLEQNAGFYFQGYDILNAARWTSGFREYPNPYYNILNTNDSIRSIFQPTADSTAIVLGLAPKTVLHFQQHLSEKLTIGISNQSVFRKNNFINILSANVLHNVGKFSFFEGINLHGISSLTVGAGLQYQGRAAQVFIAGNNIFAFYHPANNKTFHLAFGMCFLFGNKKNDGNGKASKSKAEKQQGNASKYLPFYREK